MPTYKDYPEEGEYVIITVKALNPNSAYAELDEYPGKHGMIHISELASTWVRNIKDHISVGQKTVAKVTAIDMAKGYINLSIKRVSPSVRRTKITEWRNEKKADNLLGFVAEALGKTKKEAYEAVGFILQKKFTLLYTAFEIAVESGASELVKEGLDRKWAEKIEEVAKKNIKLKEVSISGTITIRSYAPDGVNIIKAALKEGASAKNITISYLWAPRYRIVVAGKEYPSCEKSLNTATGKIIDAITKSGGEAEFARDK